MYIADTLSRAFLPDNGMESRKQSDVCLQILQMDLEEDVDRDLLKSIRAATRIDAELQALSIVVQEGWPDSKHLAPNAVRPYYSMKDQITIKNSLLFKDDRVIIPASLRNAMVKEVHGSHQGAESCLRRARESFFWPSMTAAIRDYVSLCTVCNSIQPEQAREPMQPSETPQRAWTKVAMNLF